jgi:hypothetical protein
MIALDQIHAMFRTALLDNATVAALVPGGWMQTRQPQDANGTAGAYGILRVVHDKKQQTSGGIFNLYTVTLAVYMPASTTAQTAVQTALAELFDYDRTAVTVPSANDCGVVMIAPKTVDQTVANEMRNGSDVVPVVMQWYLRTCEKRA